MHAMPDPDDKAETAGASCRDASRCILENYGARRQYSETARGFQEHVRSGLPAQMHTVKIDAIDACIEERRQATGVQDFRAMAARRSDGQAQAAPACLTEKRHDRVEHLYALARQQLHEVMIFAAGKSMSSFLFRLIPRLAHRHVETSGGEKAQHTCHAWFTIDIATIVSLEVERDERSACCCHLLGQETHQTVASKLGHGSMPSA